ncbi:19879_t:CDS:2 [Funneliformis geosporum]|uniref:2495_t:CDS:1 n=1 Tax=Funneliformis geosporum TaxID=1117311 RepID=A0A9W4WJ97_9GLOM|nr:2495_t:CDS:2 [Funneliformis geosporum]CAI2166234.1 19879_t:CDS:2 [Funneliformis geosporum]
MQKFIRSVIRWRSKHHLQKTKFQQYIDIFTNIPHEIVLIIIKHLDYNAHDIAALSSVRFFLYFPVFVNRKLRYHIKDNFLWYKLCLLYFPDNLSSEYGQTKDWMKIFRKLYWKNHTIVFAENIEEKELVSCGWFPKFGQFSDIKTDYAHPKIVRAIQESFEMDVKFESISPGIYEVVWEMNIYNLQRAQRFQFVTKIFQKNYDLVTIKEYSDTPSPEAFKRISDKGWFKYRAPKRIIIDKDQIISTKFIGHAKMCFSNPQEWPAPMIQK